MATSYYKPNLPAALNDYDLRHVKGGSVVFGSGGEVVSFKLIDDYSAIRIDGLGPHDFNLLRSIRSWRDLVSPRTSQYVRFEGREVAKTILARFNSLAFAERQRAGMLYLLEADRAHPGHHRYRRRAAASTYSRCSRQL
ncbi:hypothetical protein CPLU01_12905 [Colletotrichum plurivorum]|uniref:Uncharacterized protein n=1 Tax=Colletotrichum plurivorum TaxID=2175906 RepID=A0A8H6JW91_9PEZI|nr:hypothetical protein CPLU01_12905 [Colletotrichum plurivorum]